MDLYHRSKYNLSSFENKEKKAEPTYKTPYLFSIRLFLCKSWYIILVHDTMDGRIYGPSKIMWSPYLCPMYVSFLWASNLYLLCKSEIPILEDIPEVFLVLVWPRSKIGSKTCLHLEIMLREILHQSFVRTLSSCTGHAKVLHQRSISFQF